MLEKVGSMIVNQVAFRILNMSIAAGIIIIIVMLVRLLLKRAPKIFSYALWGIVLFRLLCPFSFSSTLSAFNLLNTADSNAGEITFVSDEQFTVVHEDNQAQNQTTDVTPHIPEYISDGQNDPAGEADGNSVMESIGGVPDAAAPDSTDHGSKHMEDTVSGIRIAKWTDFLCLIWFLGMVTLFSVNVLRLLRLRKKLSVSLKLRENIYLCDEIQTPLCLGMVRPKIYLPSTLGEEEMEYVILHEKHHIARCDHIVKVLAFLALCIHWFNPLVWAAFILAGQDMEMSCDEAVMRKLDVDIRAQYAAALLRLATGRNVFASSALSFGEGNPGQRIKNIMNYKKPVFWVVILLVIGCLMVSVTLLSNPVTKESTDSLENGNVSGEDDLSQMSDSWNETDASEVTELEEVSTDQLHPEYESLIRLAEEALQDPIKAQENYEQYTDAEGNDLFSSEFSVKNDDPNQELGYLVQDINGDGIKELMFGVNYTGEKDTMYHVIFDLYTLKDDRLVHVFDGWWRNRYYLTKEGNFINEWSSSSAEHGSVIYRFDGEKLDSGEEIQEQDSDNYSKILTYFIPFGAEWEELDDIDGNGQPEYVVYYDTEECEHSKFVYVFNLEKIYQHEDLIYVDFGDTRYVDLDHDGENEVVMRMEPHVNSADLMEYAVIKDRGGTWEKLEMYQGDTILDNSFPISVVKGAGRFEAKISVRGLDKETVIDIENIYDYWKKMSEDAAEISSWGRAMKNYYDWEFSGLSENAACAYTAAWGIWDIQYGTYQGQTCLIAEQGIDGYDKHDFWGNVFVYFDYDRNGKIRILDFTYIPYEEEYISSSMEEQIEVFASQWDELHASADYEEPAHEQFALIDFNHDGILELLVAEQTGTGHYTYTRIYQVGDGQIKEVKNNTMYDGSEPDLISSWLDMYRDAATGLEYYVAQDDLRIEPREYYQTYGGICLSEDGTALENELIGREHIFYEPEKHEYFDAGNNSLTKSAFENLLRSYYENKGYEHKKVFFTWTEKKKTSEYDAIYIIKTALLDSYQGFKEVDGDVDWGNLSADIRFDPDSRKVYFSCRGIEAADGFEIMPYWEHILNTASAEDSEDSLYHRYAALLRGDIDIDEYPGHFYSDQWDIQSRGSHFVAEKDVYGFQPATDYWGKLQVTFGLSGQKNIIVQNLKFVPSENMNRLSGKYSGETYMESYQEIINAYKTFAEKIKQDQNMIAAYQTVGSSYICEEYAAAINRGTPVYLVQDMNQDGVPELFIGIRSSQGSTNIYDAYTWGNGSSYQLLRGIGHRNGICVLCENGLIKNVSSGDPDAYQIRYQKLPPKSMTLETVETLNCSPKENWDSCQYEYQGEIVSEEEANKIIEKHRELELQFTDM